ncbi:MAG: RNA polymerase sigma factor [Ilumatobacteraceae bacterium]
MTEHEDLALVTAARQGDRDALDRLLRLHYDRIHAVCRRITGNDADAADASQEALIAIVRGLPRFDGRSKVSTWMYRVATNATLDELRRRKRRPVAVDEASGVFDHHPAGEGGEIQIDAVIDREVLETAIASLPDEFRIPVVLRDVADLDYAEIAEALSIPLGTVKSRIARGRQQLAERLGNQSDPSHRHTEAP